MPQENVKSNLTVNTPFSENTVIMLYPEAYYKIIFHSLSYAHRYLDKNSWSEVMGFLSGSLNKEDDNEFIHITKSWPISHGDTVSVTIDNYGIVLNKILIKLSETNENILGWYHSHPSYGLFMSQTDFETQISYQRLFKKAVALVFDHTLWSSIHSGIEAYRLLEDFQNFEKIPIEISNHSLERNSRLYRLFMKKITGKYYLRELDSSHE